MKYAKKQKLLVSFWTRCKTVLQKHNIEIDRSKNVFFLPTLKPRHFGFVFTFF